MIEKNVISAYTLFQEINNPLRAANVVKCKIDKRKPRVGAIENEKRDSAYVYQVSIVGSRMREQNRQREMAPDA